MPTPRPNKQNSASRGGSENESDATPNPTPSAQPRRTRKRSAHAAREGSSDQSTSQPSARPYLNVVTDATASGSATTGTGLSFLVATNAAHFDHLSDSSAFETPDQARERLALMQSTPADGESSASIREGAPFRSSRSMRSSLGLRLATDSTSTSHNQPSAFMSHQDEFASSQQSSANSAPSISSQQSEPEHLVGMVETHSTQGSSTQSRQALASISSVSMSRTSSNVSNMSPPRPTRALPRRRASARTQNRPLLSSSNSSSSSYALRSRSFSNSNVLAPSNSTANILASGQNSRQTSLAGCLPLGGGWDPNYNPPSGMSTPRTPLAEIPLWLADMRSESRRSSVSSTSFIDRDDFLSASRSASSRHARTSSTSSPGPSSPGGTRNGSTSPVAPLRSLRSRGPRPSDENAHMSTSSSYFGDFDPLPSPSISVRGEMMPLDEDSDPSASLSSSMIHLGTTSPSTPSVHLHTSSPAMSTRSRTLNRAGSVRNRRMTDPLNTPVSVEMLASSSGSGRFRNAVGHSAVQSVRPTETRERGRDENERRSASLLERRAVTAAACATSATASQPVVRTSSRPSSRTSSPAHGTRASRRRSIAVEGQSSTAADMDANGPWPNNLQPLRIPMARSGPDTGLMMLNVPAHATWNGLAPSTVIPEHSDEELAAQQAGQDEPVSPSAFSEMTSLTQGSTASESMNSAAGLPATPSSSVSNLDPFAHLHPQEGNIGASNLVPRARATAANIDADGDEAIDLSTGRMSRQSGVRRKSPNSIREANGDEESLGLQLRPRP